MLLLLGIRDTCGKKFAFGKAALGADMEQMMGRLDLVDSAGNRNYLLEKTQHIVGGFGKTVGEPPGKIILYIVCISSDFSFSVDLLHSYLGLVTLALLNEPGLEGVDAALCASKRTMQRLKSLPWWHGSHTDA